MIQKAFDVVVVGGGPAGTATALALRREGLSVAVLERSHYDDVRLGETVPPEIRSPLVRLGVWERFLAAGHRPSLAFVSSWGSPALGRRDFLLNPWGRAWHLDRSRFDAMLAAAAEEAGALVLRGADAGGASDGAGQWRVSSRRRNGGFTLQASYLVDATGRPASLVRKLGGRIRSLDRLVGVAAYLAAGPDAEPLGEAVLLEAVEDGWWYSAPLPGGKAVAAFMTDRRLTPRGISGWCRRLAGTSYTRRRLQGHERPDVLIVRPADTRFTEPPEAQRFLAVGDAATAFDPLSSQGILKALRSGLAAASAIAAHRAGHRAALAAFRADTAQGLLAHCRLRASYYQMEARWTGSPFWKPRTELRAG